MMTCVRAVKVEWSKFAGKMIGSPPDLHVRVMGYSDESARTSVFVQNVETIHSLSVWRKFDDFYCLVKVEVMQNNSSLHVDQKSTTVYLIRQDLVTKE